MFNKNGAMRLSLGYSGFGPVPPTLPMVGAAEDAGLDGVWTSEHVGFHDAVVPSACYAARTERLEIGIVGPAPASRHPALLAMELGSLAEIAPGRVRVQVGLGDPWLVGRIGGGHGGGLRRTEEFVTVLRDLLAGKQVHGEHAGHVFDEYRMAPADPPPPIDAMAVRPRMLGLAARIADGVSLSAGASRHYLAESVRHLTSAVAGAGRDRADFRITAMVMGAIAETPEAAASMVRPALELFSPDVLAVLAPDVPRNAGTGTLTGEVVSRLALAATPESLPAVLAAYAATGVDELAINLLNPPNQIADLMPVLAAARPGPMESDANGARDHD